MILICTGQDTGKTRGRARHGDVAFVLHCPVPRTLRDKRCSRSASAVRMLSSGGARRRARRRSLSTAAPALVVVFSLAWAAGLGLRRIHAGISGRRRRGRRSGAFLRVQACRPVRPASSSAPEAPSAPGERSALRRPAWSRAADLFCPSFLHHTRRPAPVSSAKTAVPALRAGGFVILPLRRRPVQPFCARPAFA